MYTVIKTVFAVFKREGISSETAVTMEEFMGTIEGVESNPKIIARY